MARIAAISFLLLGSCQADFLPFAGVEELKPARLHPFCEPADKDGHRWCTRSIVKKLEDGGDVNMDWRMHVNPDNILSLDTEAEHGVRVTKCAPGELELEVPESHEGHMQAGKFIVGSHFVHGCGHLTKKHMYHAIKQVKGKRVPFGQQSRKVSRFHLGTETLPHFAHMARHISFNFSYMPVEARDIHNRFPEMRTDFGQKELWKQKKTKKEAEEKAQEGGRRMSSSIFSSLLGGSSEPTSGTIDSGGASTGGVETSNDVVNLSPKQVSNFGWNWDFDVNATETPTYTIDQPMTKGSIVVRNPYVKAHAGCFLNFTSNFQSFTSPPHVQWQAGLKGHGEVKGRVEAAMNSTTPMDSDPASYNLPSSVMENLPFLRILQNFEEPVWFNGIDNSVGNLPVSVTPGFQFQISIYHKGPFSGYLAFGGSTHGTIEPILHFDSKAGFWDTFDGELLDTEVWPPMWMVFTEAFEMGIKGEPKLLLKGDFLGFNDAQAAVQIVPYMNVTIQRDGTLNFSADDEDLLIAYPVRVMGLDTLSFSNKYVVKIAANGREVMSSPAINWGDVEYHDPVTTFSLGSYTDTDATSLVIQVTLYEVNDDAGTNTTLGSGSFTCSDFSDEGSCTPSPAFVNIVNALNAPVAVVELAVAHTDHATTFYGSKIKGIGLSFPTVSMNDVNLATAFPSLASTITTDPLRLHVIHSGRTFLCNLNGTIAGATASLTGTALIALYPAFLETWGSCSAGLSKCTNPKLELYSGNTLVATGSIPPFGSIQTSSGASNLLASIVGATTTTTPVATDINQTLPQATLYAPDSTTTVIATIDIKVRITSPAASSLYMSPSLGQQIPLQQTTEFMWTIVGADSTKTIAFTLTPMQIQSNTSVLATDTVGYRAVNDKYLIPVSTATQTISAQCAQRTMGNISADQMPCTFVKELQFNSPTFNAGDQMVILTQWTGSDGLVHALYSPPFAIVAAGAAATSATGGRRLESSVPERWLSDSTVAVPSSEFSTNQNVDSSDPDCATKALKFNLGQGVMMRAEILSVGVPKDFPQYQSSGDDDDPLYATPWKSLGGANPEVNTNDLLPDEMCQAGMCDSMLPGCREANFKQMFFPQLLFNFSRDYFYNATEGGVSDIVKNAMAWAFSAMPEAVTVVLQKLQEQQEAQDSSTAVTDYGFGNYDQYSPRRRSSSLFGTSSSSTSSGSSSSSSSSSDALNNWWNIQRRLENQASPGSKIAVDQDGKPVVMPRRLESHQVRVEFKQGLPYEVNHHLVNMMLRHGYIRDHQNEALPITGFYFQDGGSIKIPVERKSHSTGSQSEPAAMQATAVKYLAAAGVTAGIVSAAIMITLRIQKSNSVGYEAPAEADEAGLE